MERKMKQSAYQQCTDSVPVHHHNNSVSGSAHIWQHRKCTAPVVIRRGIIHILQAQRKSAEISYSSLPNHPPIVVVKDSNAMSCNRQIAEGSNTGNATTPSTWNEAANRRKIDIDDDLPVPWIEHNVRLLFNHVVQSIHCSLTTNQCTFVNIKR